MQIRSGVKVIKICNAKILLGKVNISSPRHDISTQTMHYVPPTLQ
jgi:hypothetical protein